MEITLRKGTAAAHYVLGGPQGAKTNAFSIGTAATEINVMHGETAAAAMYSRRLVKDQDSGKSLDGTIAKMNDLIKAYAEKSRPAYCAKKGLLFRDVFHQPGKVKARGVALFADHALHPHVADPRQYQHQGAEHHQAFIQAQ